MKTALITTTINVPKVLALYRKYGPDVRFFVAGDMKSPHDQINDLLAKLASNTGEDASEQYYHPADQEGLDYKCSELIGWNCVQRRNIALLEALKWGADVIVTIDDDNIVLDNQYFFDFQRYLYYPEQQDFCGLEVSSPTGWFDVGQLLQPKASHRGFPYEHEAVPVVNSVVGARVGVAAGICLGDPDISAVTRIANGPIAHNVSQLLHSGVVTNPRKTWTVFNTQNTAFIRELAPAMFCPVGVGRYDDIMASVITQHIMRSKGLHVHFGKPFVWQQRNEHNLTKDAEAELWGMFNLTKVADVLNDIALASSVRVTDALRSIYEILDCHSWFPGGVKAQVMAWCDDCERVM